MGIDHDETAGQGRSKTDKDIRSSADKNLKPIKNKLRGVMEDATTISVINHVESLIKQATSPNNLASRHRPAQLTNAGPHVSGMGAMAVRGSNGKMASQVVMEKVRSL